MIRSMKYELSVFLLYSWPYLRYALPRLGRKYGLVGGSNPTGDSFFLMHTRHGKVTSGKELCTVPARSREIARPISSNSH